MEKVVPKIGLLLCVEGGGPRRTLDLEALATKFAKAKNVVRCEVVSDFWAPAFFDSIKKDVESGHINRILWVGRFTPQQAKFIETDLTSVGLNRYLHEWCDLDEQGIGREEFDPNVLKRKAESLIRMSLARTRLLVPLEPVEAPSSEAVLIIGAGVAGIQTAETLADLGKHVHLVEKESGVGGKVALLSRFYPRLCDPRCGLEFALSKLVKSDLAEFHTLSNVISLTGSPGNFEVKIVKCRRRIHP